MGSLRMSLLALYQCGLSSLDPLTPDRDPTLQFCLFDPSPSVSSLFGDPGTQTAVSTAFSRLIHLSVGIQVMGSF